MLDLSARVCVSVGGSTNIMLHYPAIAREGRLHMTMKELGEISKTTPYLAKIKPSGIHTMLDFDEAGGVGAVLKPCPEWQIWT